MALLESAIVAASMSAASVQADASPPAQRDAATRERRSESDIMVTGQRPPVQSQIDRTSYRISDDLHASTGTLADVLRNVPFVEVDPFGNVSIRGDSNVIILIDGQPSSSFRGPGRATALQTLSANRYERVEVMTNPSAAYGAEGSGGIINLVSKRTPAAGSSGSARLNVGGRGRANAGGAVNHGFGRATVNADVGGRIDQLSGTVARQRTSLSGGSAPIRTGLDARSDTRTESVSMRGGLERRLGPRAQLSFTVTGSDASTDTRTDEIYLTDVAGQEVPDQQRLLDSSGRFSTIEARGNLLRRFAGEDHRAAFDLSVQRSRADRNFTGETFVNEAAAEAEKFRFATKERLATAKAEYFRPLGDSIKLQIGVEFEWQDNRFRNEGARGASLGSLVGLDDFTNEFRHGQTVGSLYTTVEKRSGKLSWLAGLRVERTGLDLRQVTTNERFLRSYTRLYPTLHTTFDLSDKQQLKASFSRRVQRPGGADLNPFLEYRDPFNLRVGNPNLRPQITDSVELAWQNKAGSTFYQATLFHRAVRDSLTFMVEEIEDGILLTRRENLGRSRLAGIELVANRKVAAGIMLNASATIAHNSIRLELPGFSGTQAGWQISGRANLTWNLSLRDTLQLSSFLTGKTLRPQGYRVPSGMINLGYRRKLSESLFAIATIRDLAGRFGETIVYEDDRFRDRAKRLFGGRVVFVGIAKTFGPTRREQNFNFEAGRSE